MTIRIVITLALIAVGIGVMYALQGAYGGLSAVMVGSLFFLFALSVWTLPVAAFERGNKLDPMQKRIIGAFLGIGLGMFGGLAVAALVPRPFNWIVLGAVALLAVALLACLAAPPLVAQSLVSNLVTTTSGQFWGNAQKLVPLGVWPCSAPTARSASNCGAATARRRTPRWSPI